MGDEAKRQGTAEAQRQRAAEAKRQTRAEAMRRQRVTEAQMHGGAEAMRQGAVDAKGQRTGSYCIRPGSALGLLRANRRSAVDRFLAHTLACPLFVCHQSRLYCSVQCANAEQCVHGSIDFKQNRRGASRSPSRSSIWDSHEVPSRAESSPLFRWVHRGR